MFSLRNGKSEVCLLACLLDNYRVVFMVWLLTIIKLRNVQYILAFELEFEYLLHLYIYMYIHKVWFLLFLTEIAL